VTITSAATNAFGASVTLLLVRTTQSACSSERLSEVRTSIRFPNLGTGTKKTFKLRFNLDHEIIKKTYCDLHFYEIKSISYY
jgi:hypothetical protein